MGGAVQLGERIRGEGRGVNKPKPHNGEKLSNCNQCNFTSSHEGGLKKHMKIFFALSFDMVEMQKRKVDEHCSLNKPLLPTLTATLFFLLLNFKLSR